MELNVKRAQKGDKEAFVTLIKHCETSMYRVARSILKDDTDCADAIQEAIIKAYNGIGALREVRYFKTWLIRIVINECKGILTERKKTIPMNQIVESDPSQDKYEQIEIREVVDSLDDQLRELVTLYYFEDLPLKEIAAVLNQPEGTLKSRLHRARTKLAQMLKVPTQKEALL